MFFKFVQITQMKVIQLGHVFTVALLCGMAKELTGVGIHLNLHLIYAACKVRFNCLY